jgi:plastocyanin
MPASIRRASYLPLVALAALLVQLRAGPAQAQPASSAADVERLKADVARLEQELRQQKQLLLQLMQGEQQRYDMLMQLIRSGQAGRVDPAAALPPPPSAAVAPVAAASPGAPAASPGAAPVRTTAPVSGRVRFPAGAVEAYVYVEGVRGGSGRGKQLEIRQQGKQFSPQTAVVLTGTKVTFPNYDSVSHNAFSKSSGNAFDLGGIKAGEKSGEVVLSKPGHVEVFCNIHSKMRADILVVQSSHYARVKPDGSFELSGVPMGTRKIAVWSPDLKPASQTVEVTGNGASVSFTPEAGARRAHLNKFGNSYGSYNE